MDSIDLLLSRGLIAPAIADAARRAPKGASSRVSALLAAGADPAVILELAALTKIPIATPEIVEQAEAVALPEARLVTLRNAFAAPLRRDPNGTLYLLVAEPEAKDVIDQYFVGTRLFLTRDSDVRAIFSRFYGGPPEDSSGEGAIEIDLEASRRMAAARGPSIVVEMEGAEELKQPLPLGGFDVDMEASRKNAPAPAPAPGVPPAAPPRTPAPRPGTPAAAHRRQVEDEETMRVSRAPRSAA
ncbi:MAG TPA: hypothetical protein VGM56_13075, partial [Byssovorax sp.]